MILDTKQLYSRLQKNQIHLLDVRTYDEYRQSHIPKAIHFDLKQANSSKPPINGLLPNIQAFETYANSIGLSQQPVIIYDQQGDPPSGRVAWTLMAFGHADVSILDGGLKAWVSEERGVDRHEPKPAPGDFKAKLMPELIVDRQQILEKLNDQNVVFLDVRSADEFNGIDIRSARGGHIPGATHMNWAESKDPANSNRFKPENSLIKDLENLGINKDKEVIVYCQTHQRSALMCVLLNDLGYQHVKGYPGAWSDWGNAHDTPIE